MRLSELLRRVTPELPDFDPEITFITDDSRKVKPGCAFVCIRGNHIDGHTLAAKAVESGAAAVIAQADTGLSCQVLVPDTRAAYSLMCEALFHDPAQRLHLIGITGTNGKTTSAFLIKEILDAAGYRTGSSALCRIWRGMRCSQPSSPHRTLMSSTSSSKRW